MQASRSFGRNENEKERAEHTRISRQSQYFALVVTFKGRLEFCPTECRLVGRFALKDDNPELLFGRCWLLIVPGTMSA